MKSQLLALKGSKIEAIEKIYDYLQIKFSNGAILNIYNKYKMDSENTEDFEKVGVTEILFDSESFSIISDRNKSITVGLKDNDYNGPEAMELTIKNSFFVWN